MQMLAIVHGLVKNVYLLIFIVCQTTPMNMNKHTKKYISI